MFIKENISGYLYQIANRNLVWYNKNLKFFFTRYNYSKRNIQRNWAEAICVNKLYELSSYNF